MSVDERLKLLSTTAFTGVAAIALVAAMPAQAQDIEEIEEIEEDEAETDRIVVTGSRIRRELDATIPVTTVGQLEYQERGFVNTIESLEQLPFVGPGVNNSGNSTQFGDNNAFVDLLNFGTQRTLTLVDGRRFVSSNQGTVFVPGNATGAQVDLTIINPALIKRTEIQTVGAGPIYGADAVAGVVNVILDREFEGLEFSAQAGITGEGDGENYRVSGAWGTEILDGRGNFIVAADYLESRPIYADQRDFLNNFGTINNPFGDIPGGNDQFATLFQENQLNQTIPVAGLLNIGQNPTGSTASFYFPTTTGNSLNDPAFNAFVDATGRTPFEFALLNPGLNGIDPLAFVGTFGLTSGFPTVANTDPASLALGLDRVARPLIFNPSGDLIAYSLGAGVVPPNVADQNDIVGVNQGFNPADQQTLIAGQERFSFNSLWSYDIADNIRYEGDFLFSAIENRQRSNGSGTQAPGASVTAGNAPLPIYFNQNPFVTQSSLDRIDQLQANGATFGQLNGEDVFYLSRSLFDVTGGLDNEEGNDSTTFGTSHALKGDFVAINRDFYWDVSVAWSRNKSENKASTDILDVEFALATDVVLDSNGNAVCRQQTLSAPEAIDVRNPFLSNINIATGIVPTQAQIDACQPLNLMGAGNASQAAIDYVTGNGDSENIATQTYAAASLGGDLVQLPAGFVQFNAQIEFRLEELEFTPNSIFQNGTGRQTIGQASDGEAQFIEVGSEFNIPVFGGDFAPIFARRLEIDGAVRIVNRTGSGTPFGINGPRVDVEETTATTFTAGGRWSPFEDFTIRGNRTRAVRSPSITESLGAPQTGFSNLVQFFPCNGFFRTGGPSSGIRNTNCETLEGQLGIPIGSLGDLRPPAGTVPAGVGGNPGLENETSDNWTIGFVYQPRFIPGLSISADWNSLYLEDEIGLTFLGTQCFDQTSFPNSVIGGVNSCESITIATGPEGDLFGLPVTIPDNNIITGNPVIPPAIPGSLAPVQEPFTVAAAQFSNANSGSRRLDAVIANVRYDFGMADLLNVFGLTSKSDWGDITVNGRLYWIDRYQTSGSGTFEDANELAGEPGNEEFQSRVDLTHRIGNLTHTLQWFRDSEAVENVQQTDPLSQDPLFFRPEQNFFNYNLSYEFNENFTGRLIVNNITNFQDVPEFGFANDSIGRRFIVRVDARF